MVGGVQNVAGGAVVLLQADGDGVLVLVLKVQNVLDGSAPELVNALVVIAHHTEIAPAAGQQGAQHILGVVGILILIHQHIAELALIILPHIILGLEQLHGLADDVVKVQGAGLAAALLVFGIDAGHCLFIIVLPRLGGKILGHQQGLLGPGDGGHDALGVKALFVEAEVPDHRHDHALFVVLVINGKVGGIAQPLNIPPQNAGAGGVEGVGPDVPSLVAAGHLQPGFQLAGGLVGKGDGDDLPGFGRVHGAQAGNFLLGHRFRVVHGPGQGHQVAVPRPLGRQLGFIAAAEPQQVDDAVDEHGGLSAAGACQKQKGPFCLEHGLPLHIIELGELIFNDGAPQGGITNVKIVHSVPHGFFLFRYGPPALQRKAMFSLPMTGSSRS